MLDDPSRLLATYSRSLLHQESGLISVLSEEERATFAEELTRSGWRGLSPMVQSTLTRVLSESSRRLGPNSSKLQRDASAWLEQPSGFSGASSTEADSYVSAQPGIPAILDPSDVWVPTAADREVSERPWQPPKTRESSTIKQRAIQQVRAFTACALWTALFACVRPHALAPRRAEP